MKDFIGCLTLLMERTDQFPYDTRAFVTAGKDAHKGASGTVPPYVVKSRGSALRVPRDKLTRHKAISNGPPFEVILCFTSANS